MLIAGLVVIMKFVENKTMTESILEMYMPQKIIEQKTL
jgi:hypothetical protein